MKRVTEVAIASSIESLGLDPELIDYDDVAPGLMSHCRRYGRI